MVSKTFIKEIEPESLFLPAVCLVTHGVERNYVFDADFFDSADYQSITRLGHRLKPFHSKTGSITIERGEKTQKVNKFEEALEWLQGEALRGQTRQRYKGLGEMNPDQLWETTMDPATRILSRVKINDESENDAEEIFVKLMGEEVEPRRKFIEENALNVLNLDI